jgi:hypothetical protein
MKIRVLAIRLKKDYSEGEMIYKTNETSPAYITKNVVAVYLAHISLVKYPGGMMFAEI